jgi:hypothetical protein
MKDHIVEEVHQAREQLFRESKRDLQKLMDYLQRCEEKEKGLKFVTKEEIRKR